LSLQRLDWNVEVNRVHGVKEAFVDRVRTALTPWARGMV
jgi:hypothetical protein